MRVSNGSRKGTWRTAGLGGEQHQVMFRGSIGGSQDSASINGCGFAGGRRGSCGRPQNARGAHALQNLI